MTVYEKMCNYESAFMKMFTFELIKNEKTNCYIPEKILTYFIKSIK